MSTKPLPDGCFRITDMDHLLSLFIHLPAMGKHERECAVASIIANIQVQAERIAELEEFNATLLHTHEGLAIAVGKVILRAEAAEAELALVREWARGRCECCQLLDVHTGPCHRYFRGADGHCTAWTPAWG